MGIKLTPRTTTVILFQGDDIEPAMELLREVQSSASVSTPLRMGDSLSSIEGPVRDYDTFIEGASDRAVHLRLTALPRKAYRALLSEHPVRQVPAEDGSLQPEPIDAEYGFNFETFGDALIGACVDLEQFDSEAERDEFIESLSDGDYSKVYSAALGLNRSLGPDPKLRLSTHLDLTSGETSEPPARLG